MQANRILVFEDDATQREALKSVLTKAGAIVFVTEKETEAREIIEEKEINIIFIDCLLPGMSGVEFIESIRKKFPPELLQVIFMSGIFTDAAFVKDAIRSTHAKAFLKKPFDLKDVLSLLPKNLDEKTEEFSPRRALYQMFNRVKVPVREKRKLIESLDDIHGFDLPFIYSLLTESKMSGHLNIASTSGEVSGISFSQGVIVSVDIADKETFLGKLLIESGYILPDDLNDALTLKSAKKIGERLIQNNLLSPHAFDIVLSNQMNIRLSRTIVDDPVKINFVETDIEMTTPNIDSHDLVAFLHDWVAGKITIDWLKTHYMQWGNYKLGYGPNYSKESSDILLPLITTLDGFLVNITSGDILNKIIEVNNYPEEPFFKALHFSLTRGLVIFTEQVKEMNTEDISKSLKKISLQFAGKNKLEIYDQIVRITNGSESEPDTIIKEFLKILGSTSGTLTPEQNKLRATIEKQAMESYEFVRSGDRDQLREEMEKTEVEIKLKAASQFEEAKNCLQRAQFSVAYQMLIKAAAVDPSIARFKLYMAWAKLGLIESKKQIDKKLTLKDVEIDLLQVAPEDKFDALYHFVMGFYYRLSKDFSAARRAFEKALNMDSNMIVARRELSKLTTGEQPKKDVLNRDLKDLVSGFFGKKK